MTVPFWRTRMLPALTTCPPYALTPRIFGPESRPLREAPCPFLCAMVLRLDRRDLQRRERLAGAVLAAVALAAGVLVDVQLLAAPGADDLGRHLGAGDV